MRVIKYGTDKEFDIICPQCRSELQYTTEDITNGKIQCPVCQQFISATCEVNINPHPKYSYNSGLCTIGGDNKPVWGLDVDWVIYELEHGRIPKPD